MIPLAASLCNSSSSASAVISKAFVANLTVLSTEPLVDWLSECPPTDKTCPSIKPVKNGYFNGNYFSGYTYRASQRKITRCTPGDQQGTVYFTQQAAKINDL